MPNIGPLNTAYYRKKPLALNKYLFFNRTKTNYKYTTVAFTLQNQCMRRKQIRKNCPGDITKNSYLVG